MESALWTFVRKPGVEPTNNAAERALRGGLNGYEFRIGDLSSLEDHSFDIVLCLGLLHHLEAPSEAIRTLRKGCRGFMILETICLSSEYITDSFRDDMELKDIIYNYQDKICGVSGQKFESSYYDGSSTHLSVVTIPSVESLRMYLGLYFDEVRIVADPKDYMKSFGNSDRSCNAICISAVPAAVSPREDQCVREYEGGLAEAILEGSLIQALYRRYVTKEPHLKGIQTLLVIGYLEGAPWWSSRCMKWIARRVKTQYEIEIIRNFRFNPADKIALEMGKWLAVEGHFDESKAVLKRITTKLNADWRCVYRAFHLLAKINEFLGGADEAERYLELCRTCNPLFPTDMEPLRNKLQKDS